MSFCFRLKHFVCVIVLCFMGQFYVDNLRTLLICQHLKVLWNTTKIDSHCFVKCFFNTFLPKIVEKIISYEVYSIFKTKKRTLVSPIRPAHRKSSETILTVWRHNKKRMIQFSRVASLRAERIAPLVFYMMNCMQFFVDLRFDQYFSKMSLPFGWAASKMPGQNANTLYCGCWLFQYNKGCFLPERS